MSVLSGAHLPSAHLSQGLQQLQPANPVALATLVGLAPKPEWGSGFKLETGQGYQLPNGNTFAVYVLEDSAQQLQALLSSGDHTKELIVAHIVERTGGMEFVAKATATGPTTFGIIVYNTEGKPIMSGPGVLDTGNSTWHYDLHTLYTGINPLGPLGAPGSTRVMPMRSITVTASGSESPGGKKEGSITIDCKF